MKKHDIIFTISPNQKDKMDKGIYKKPWDTLLLNVILGFSLTCHVVNSLTSFEQMEKMGTDGSSDNYAFKLSINPVNKPSKYEEATCTFLYM